MDNAGDGKELVRYLLGELPEAEEKELERRYFADEALFEQLGAAETELVDAYVRGELSAGERQRLEARFLQVPRGRLRLQFAEDLHRLTSRRKAGNEEARHEIEPRKRAAFWMRRTGLRLLLPVAAAVLIGVVIFSLWRAQQGASERDLAHRGLTLPEPAPTAGPDEGRGVTGPPEEAQSRPQTRAGDGVIAVTLNPGLLRDIGQSSTLVLSPGAEQIRLTVRLETRISGSCRAILSTVEGREVWRQDEVRAPAGDPTMLVMDIPASVVRAGDYILTIAAKAGGRFEDIADYYFRVVSRN